MTQRDGGFGGGFLVGAIVGGVVGGFFGVILAGDLRSSTTAESRLGKKADSKSFRARSRELKAEEGIEVARRSLEDKIAQLNATIDDVRQQLGSVNGAVSSSEPD
jgi:gas vesicle protein